MAGAVLDKIAELITVTFGLVAALAWNEAISSWIKSLDLGGGPWVYAILETILAVFATSWIGRAAARAKEQLK